MAKTNYRYDPNKPLFSDDELARFRSEGAGSSGETGLMRRVGDWATSFGEGALGVESALASAAGADNGVVEFLDTGGKAVAGLRSDEAKARREEHARLMKEAESAGAMAEIGQAFSNFADAPADYTAQAAGSVVGLLPFSMGAKRYLKGIGLSANAAQIGAGTLVGAPVGVGATKKSQYDEVYNWASSQGYDEPTARQMATEAQAYGSDNLGQHALGAGLGVVDLLTGGDAALLGGKLAGKNWMQRGVRRGAEEFGTEFPQAFHEKYAGNVAAIDAGDTTRTPTQGAWGAGTQEGLMGLGVGGGFGITEGYTPTQAEIDASVAKARADQQAAQEAERLRVEEEALRAQAEADLQAQEDLRLKHGKAFTPYEQFHKERVDSLVADALSEGYESKYNKWRSENARYNDTQKDREDFKKTIQKSLDTKDFKAQTRSEWVAELDKFAQDQEAAEAQQQQLTPEQEATYNAATRDLVDAQYGLVPPTQQVDTQPYQPDLYRDALAEGQQGLQRGETQDMFTTLGSTTPTPLQDDLSEPTVTGPSPDQSELFNVDGSATYAADPTFSPQEKYDAHDPAAVGEFLTTQQTPIWQQVAQRRAEERAAKDAAEQAEKDAKTAKQRALDTHNELAKQVTPEGVAALVKPEEISAAQELRESPEGKIAYHVDSLARTFGIPLTPASYDKVRTVVAAGLTDSISQEDAAALLNVLAQKPMTAQEFDKKFDKAVKVHSKTPLYTVTTGNGKKQLTRFQLLREWDNLLKDAQVRKAMTLMLGFDLDTKQYTGEAPLPMEDAAVAVGFKDGDQLRSRARRVGITEANLIKAVAAEFKPVNLRNMGLEATEDGGNALADSGTQVVDTTTAGSRAGLNENDREFIKMMAESGAPLTSEELGRMAFVNRNDGDGVVYVLEARQRDATPVTGKAANLAALEAARQSNAAKTERALEKIRRQEAEVAREKAEREYKAKEETYLADEEANREAAALWNDLATDAYPKWNALPKGAKNAFLMALSGDLERQFFDLMQDGAKEEAESLSFKNVADAADLVGAVVYNFKLGGPDVKSTEGNAGRKEETGRDAIEERREESRREISAFESAAAAERVRSKGTGSIAEQRESEPKASEVTITKGNAARFLGITNKRGDAKPSFDADGNPIPTNFNVEQGSREQRRRLANAEAAVRDNNALIQVVQAERDKLLKAGKNARHAAVRETKARLDAAEKALHDARKTVADIKNEIASGTDTPTSVNEASVEGMSAEAVQAVVDQVKPKLGRNAPRIVVMNHPREVSKDLHPNVAGIVRNGTAYLFADNINSAAHAEEVLYHEIKGHVGLRGFFGDRLDKALVALYAASPRIRAAAERERAKNPDRFKRMTPDQAIAKLTEEVLANMAGAKLQGTALNRFVAAAIKALRAMGFTKFADKLENATMATALDMLAKAGSYVREGKTGRVGAYQEVKLDAATSIPAKVTSKSLKMLAQQLHDAANGIDIFADGQDLQRKLHSVARDLGSRARQFSDVELAIAESKEVGNVKRLARATAVRDEYIELAQEAIDKAKALMKESESSTKLQEDTPTSIGRPEIVETPEQFLDAMSNVFTSGFKRMAKGFMSLRDLGQAYSSNSGMGKHVAAVLESGAMTSQMMARYAPIQERILQLQKDRRALLTKVMMKATLSRATLGDTVSANDEVKGLWNSLTAQEKRLYAQARDFFKQNYEERKRLIEVKAKRLNIKPPVMPTWDGDYFPLTREGEFVVVWKSPELEAAEKANDTKRADQLREDRQHYYVSFEKTERARERKLQQLKEKGYTGAYWRERTEYARETSAVNKAFLDKLEASLADLKGKDGSSAYSADVQQAVRDLYIRSLPDLHAMKRELGRLGVEGVKSDEMLHGMAKAATADAFHLARLAKQDEILDTLQEIRDNDPTQELYNHMQKRLAQSMKVTDTPRIDAVASFTYANMLGTSPAFLMINMAQPWMLSMPTLAARKGVGYTRATKELAKGAQDAMRIIHMLAKEYGGGKASKGWRYQLDFAKADLTDGEKQMLNRLMDLGLLNVSLESDTLALAQGADKMATFNRVMSFAPHMVEQVNRIGVALAAYRTSVERNGKVELNINAATSVAEKLVADTQFDYSAANTPYLMMGNHLGGMNKLIMQFRRYQQGMAAFLIKQTAAAAKGDKEAARALFGVLASHSLIAGAAGLPLVPIAWIAKAIAQAWDDDDEPDPEQWWRETFPEWARKGLPSIVGLDLSQRMGLANIFNPMPYAQSKGNLADSWKETLATASMPAAGSTYNAMRALDAFSNGEIMKGVGYAAPKFLADFAKAYRYYEEGLETGGGRTVFTPEEMRERAVWLKAAGITDSDVTDYYDRNQAKESRRDEVNQVRQKLLKEAAKLGRLTPEIIAFNKRHPGPENKSVRIDPADIRRSAKQRAEDEDNRTSTGITINEQDEWLRRYATENEDEAEEAIDETA